MRAFKAALKFLQLNSLDKSELDMQAIEGQTAGTSLVKALLKIPDEVATSLIKQKSEVKDFHRSQN